MEEPIWGKFNNMSGSNDVIALATVTEQIPTCLETKTITKTMMTFARSSNI